jgi:glycosyltransferase involved in cell wall biosynthesis
VKILRVTVVLPTKNESKTIESVINNIRSEFENSNKILEKIIITDDSTDDTRKIAEKAGAEVVIGGGRGLGAAMFRGLKVAARSNCDCIVSMDSDGQVDCKEIEIFSNHIARDEADLVIGSRFMEKEYVKYNYHLINRFGVLVLSTILSKITKQKITDSHGGIRAMKPEVVNCLELIGTHTYVQETIIDAYENGYRVLEIPSLWHKRESGKSRVVLSIPKYVFYTLPVLILRSGHHIKLLFPLGISFLLLSFIDIAIVSYETRLSLNEMFERQSFNLMLLLFGTGLNILLFGFILEMISHIRRKSS